MVEINPLVMTTDDKLLAADSKITIDNNAFYRQKDIFAQEDTSADDPREAAAAKWDLNYIHIGGNIGCLVNGAGLAMSTMDIIKLYGGEPANFLDVGGSAVGEALKQAMILVHDDPEVEVIFVNIFGGILDTYVLGQAILEADISIKFKKPIVLRMKGLNADKSEELFRGREEELNIHYITDFDTAA
jgi:succinyl-CoA synthetase beta subunit